MNDLAIPTMGYLVALGVGWLCVSPANAAERKRPPNIVVIFADDLGYGDLGCYGAAPSQTPHLDRMAQKGVRFTDFYAAQPVCSASRAGLLTGCYPNRIGIHGALSPAATVGIADAETTIAELLKSKGYATCAVGKWHLGHLPPFLPTRHGFDEYLGLPYSNDMWPHHPEAKTKERSYPNLPLIDGDKVVDAEITPEEMSTLTRRYTERAVDFIQRQQEQPFFLYFAHTMPHVPLYAGKRFQGVTQKGVYADVLREIDWSVGEVIGALEKAGVAQDTLVIFTSDNGPWLNYGNHGGSAGPLREGKGTVWEGGIREPFLAYWPGTIRPNTVQHAPAMTIDLLPTIAHLTGCVLPQLPIDGKNIWPLIQCEPGATTPHEAYWFYYKVHELQAIRSGKWKLIFPHSYRTMQGQAPGKDGTPGKYRMQKVTSPELYDLEKDIGERHNLAVEHPEVVQRLQALANRARADLGDALTSQRGTGRRSAGTTE
ncbi:MAG: sulfatase [Bacteroidales bacterium]|nr:sulfatase [Bacteroidales bacterium]